MSAGSSSPPALRDWLPRQRRLVQAEHDWLRAEERELVEKAGPNRLAELGLALTRLELVDCAQGASGQLVSVTLRRRSGLPLPAQSQFSARDAVLLRWPGQASGAEPRGVVQRLNEAGSLTVAFTDLGFEEGGGRALGGGGPEAWATLEDLLDRNSGNLILVKVADEVTQRCLVAAIDRLERYADAREPLAAGPVLDVLYGAAPPQLPARSKRFSPLNPRLNGPQLQAIGKALAAPEVHLIHGPPGTGKTTTIVELILQAVIRGERVIACAPSNIAADGLCEGLARYADVPLPRRRVAAQNRKQLARGNHRYHDSDDEEYLDTGEDASPEGAGNGKPAAEPKVVDTRPLQFCRLGHPARLMDGILRHGLDALVARSDAAKLVSDLEAEIRQVQAELSARRGTYAAPEGAGGAPQGDQSLKNRSPAELRAQLRQLRRDLRQRAGGVVKGVLASCDVVLCTLTGIRALPAAAGEFDLIVIDEAAQALELACVQVLCRSGRRLVLAGDHQQLPPVVKHPDPKISSELARTLFGRVHQAFPGLTSMLTVQYRMHENIMGWSSEQFYDSRLQAHDSVAAHLLRDLLPAGDRASPAATPAQDAESSPAGVASDAADSSAEQQPSPVSAPDEASAAAPDDWSDLKDANSVWNCPLWVWDTAGCGLWEDTRGQAGRKSLAAAASPTGHDISHSNPGEADLVVKHLEVLLRHLSEDQVAVISPYAGQVRLIRQRTAALWPGVEVGTVDGFQGREKEAIVMSFVRSNPDGEVGFLAEYRRTNVAVTRARRHLALIFDSSTLGRDRRLESLVDFASEHGEYRSAEELLAAAAVTVDAEAEAEAAAAPSPSSAHLATAAAAELLLSERTRSTNSPKADEDAKEDLDDEASAVAATPAEPAEALREEEESKTPSTPQETPEQGEAPVAGDDGDAFPDDAELAADLALLEEALSDTGDAETAGEAEPQQQQQQQQQSQQASGNPLDFMRLRREYTEARILSDLKAFQRKIERKRAQIIRQQLNERRNRDSEYLHWSQTALRREQQRLLHEDPELQLIFPALLSSYQRQVVHSVCEQLGGLWHRSASEGLDRHIVVRAGSPDGKNSEGDPNPRAKPSVTVSPSGKSVSTNRRPERQQRSGGGGQARSGRQRNPSGHAAPAARETPLSVLQRLNAGSRPTADEALQRLQAAGAQHPTPRSQQAEAEPRRSRSAPAPDLSGILEPVSSFGFGSLALEDEAGESSEEEEKQVVPAARPGPSPRPNQQPSKSKKNKNKGKQQQSAQPQQQQQQQQQQRQPPQQQSKSSSAAAGRQQASPRVTDEDDDDAIFAEFRPGKCKIAGCKQSVRFTGSVCDFCKEVFCVSHMNAYLHGCGEEAGKNARQRMMQQAMGGSSRPMDDRQRAQLKKKLDEKAKEARQGPQKKPKKDKKK